VLSPAAITSILGATITQNANAAVTLTTDGQGDLTVAKIVKGAGAGDITVAAGIKVPAGATGGNIKTIAGNTITNNGTGKTLIYTGSALNSGLMSNLMSSLSILNLTGGSKNTAVHTAYGSGGGFSGGPATQVLFRESVDLTGSLTAATINTTYGDAAPITAAIKTAIINANGGAGADIVTTLAAGTFKAALDDVATDLANNATLVATANSFGRLNAYAAGYNYTESATANYAASGASVVKLVVAKANLTKVEGAKTYDGQINTLVAGSNGSLILTGVASETASLNSGNSVNLTGANAGTQAVLGLGTNAAFTSTNGLNLANYNVADADMSALASALPSKNTVAIAKAKLTEVTGAKTYDGNTNLSGGTLSIKGVNGEVFTTDQSTVVLGSKNVVGTDGFGANSVTNLSGLALTGTTSTALSSNYDQAQSPSTSNIVTINKANLAVAMSNQTKVYDGTVTATLAAGAITATGVTVGSVTETATVSQTSGTYNDKNVNGATTVTANLLPVDFASGTADLSNYNLPSTVSNTSSNITKKDVTYSGVGVATKTYDGTTAAVLSGTAALATVAAGSSVSNDTKVITTDTVSLGGTVAGTFANKNVLGTDGAGANTVALTGASLSGTDASNYTLIQQATVTANNQITKKDVTYSGVGVATKTYDGTTAAVLSGTTALATVLAGSSVANDNKVVAGDNVALTGTAVGTYDSKDVATTGNNVTFTGKSLSKANASGADDTSNYNLVQQAKVLGDGTITAKTVNLTGTRAYDGTTAVAATDLAVATGVSVNGKSEVLNLSGSGLIASKNFITDSNGAVQARQLSDKDTLVLSNKTGDNATTIDGLASNYVIDKTQSTVTINKANLTASVTAEDKVYNGNQTATVTASSDKLASDTVMVAVTSAEFSDKNVARDINGNVITKTVTASGLSISGADAGNYTLTNTTATAANAKITPKQLKALYTATNKVYDGNTNATVTGTLTDIVTGDAVTATHTSATFDTAAAGTNKTVTVAGIALTGGDASNYKLDPVVNLGNKASAKASITAALSIAPAPVVPTSASSSGGRVKIPTPEANPFQLASNGGLVEEDFCSDTNDASCACEETSQDKEVQFCTSKNSE
jgi:hypothetical protein